MTTTTPAADLSALAASRKADRAKIAAEYRRIAERFGATVTERQRDAHHGYCGAGVDMTFSLNGVRANVSINDLHERHGQDGALISWYTTEPSEEYHARRAKGLPGVRYFAPGFNAAVGEYGKSARPHHKATSIGSWALLGARLQAGLRHAERGSAFLPDTEEPSA